MRLGQKRTVGARDCLIEYVRCMVSEFQFFLCSSSRLFVAGLVSSCVVIVRGIRGSGRVLYRDDDDGGRK
jgi:hypothetical protein